MTARGCRGCLKRAGAYTQSTERGTTKRPLQDGCGPAGQSESGAGDWSANQDALSTGLLFLNLLVRRGHNITRRETERGADNR